MEYKPLQTMNPTQDDVSVKSSNWLMSRIMPGKGNGFITSPSGSGALSIGENDAKLSGMVMIADSSTVTTITNEAMPSIEWKGAWLASAYFLLGHCSATKGLAAPLNTFNAGYRYKRGWRPKKDAN